MSTAEARWLLDRVGRDLTRTEATLFDVAWSEHCSYNSSRVLLKKHLPPMSPDVVLGPGEDAGIVRLGEAGGREWCLVAAHESHNHPSQVVPIEGAATGVGGIVRDVYCMGADVIGVLDQLRFGDPRGPAAGRVVEIARGVIRGIWEYGNALGVPNLGGDVGFDAGYDDNCLVNVVALGVVPRDRILRSRVPEEARSEPFDIILVGKPTDSSGMGGASFASRLLDPEREAEERGAVQIHDPFLKRVLVEATKRVWGLMTEEGWPAGFKDLGAGGLGGASSELVLAAGMGARIDLDQVPTGEHGLGPETILCAETQERFVWAVPRRVSEKVLHAYNVEFDLPRCSPGAGAAVVGEVVPGGAYEVWWRGERVVALPRETLGDPPALERPRSARTVADAALPVPAVDDWQGLAEELAGSVEAGCREWVHRHYDSEVRGATVLRPGDGEACVVSPIPDSDLGVAVSVGGNHHISRLDPRVGGEQAVAEAVRHLVAVGARPLALTDGLNFGNPEDPEVLWDFDQTLLGMRRACEGLGALAGADAIPIISGNVSFYNESERGRAIPPTPILAGFGKLDAASGGRPNRAWAAGQEIVLVRGEAGSWGGSLASRILGSAGGAPWAPQWPDEVSMARGLLKAHEEGLVAACRDISDGGLLLALMELVLLEDSPPGLGIRIDVEAVETGGTAALWLLAEGTGYLAVARQGSGEALVRLLHGEGAPAAVIGRVIAPAVLQLPDGVDIALESVWRRWRDRLEETLA
jgi:phosphoribosylformylglycinamidine synthase